MNDAQQEMSPDFVLMRLVSAAEYDRLDEPDDLIRSGGGGFGPVKAALGHHGGGSPLPGKGELEGGLGLSQGPASSEAPLSPPPEDFAAAAQRFVDGSAGHGSRAQLMVLQNLLRSGLEQPSPAGFLQEEPERQKLEPGPGSGSASTAGFRPGGGLSKGSDGPQNPPPVPALDPESIPILCHRHRLAKWPPGLLDQALRLGLLELRRTCPSGAEDPVLVLAQKLGQLGEGREGLGEGDRVPLSPRCSCHSILAAGPVAPGDDPSDTSDALLVLEGLGSEQVGELPAGTVFSAGTLSGLMRQVHRLAEEAGVCTEPTCRAAATPPAAPQGPPATGAAPPDPGPRPQHQHQSRSQPQSRAATPKLGVAAGGAGRAASPLTVLEGGNDRTPRRKSRKGGSLKVRLSKLFRTKSSSGGSGGLLDKRPSLASSTSSGGSLLDVWGSTCSSTDQDRLQVSRPHSAFSPVPFTPAFTGETVSLVDVDISRRGGSAQPPRRSLSLLDDFGGPPQHQGPFTERSAGASMQSLPPRPLALHPTLSTIQHSLSLNVVFTQNALHCSSLPAFGAVSSQVAFRHVFSWTGSEVSGSFATSLRELEKCGWYWGPMNWEDAEMKLKGKPDGSFLVRDSSDPRYILSLSFRSQGVTHHTRMEHYRGRTFSLWCHPKFEDRCHSVVEFIERAIMHSKNGKFLYFLRSRVPAGLPPTPVQLLYPVSRFSSVKSLQHLCRFCIRQLVRIDHIQELPLPTPLIAYLRKFYYYDPEEEISAALPDRKEAREPSSQPGVRSQT
uniref:Suppressor of cytokine signaling 7 n=1 Tax=Poecilia formosa TaxID=48698 RepID=A0A087XTS7_POEFO